MNGPKSRVHKVYMVCVRWVSIADTGMPLVPERVDLALSPLGDWLRYNGSTWLVHTDLKAQNVYTAVQRVVQPSDSVLVIRVDPKDIGGVAPQHVWDWVQSKRPPFTLADLKLLED